MEILGNIWVWLAALVLWLSPEARARAEEVVGGVVNAAQVICRFIGAAILWVPIMLIIALILMGISIITDAMQLKIAAIALLTLWTIVLWISFATAATLVGAALGLTSDALAPQRTAIENALKKPSRFFRIIIVVLGVWAIQIFIWQTMPVYVSLFAGFFVTVLALLEAIENVSVRRLAKTFLMIAAIVFASKVGWSCIQIWAEHSNSWPAVKINNLLKKQDLAAKKERLEIPFENPLVRTLTLAAYKQRYGFEPLVVLLNGQDLPSYDANIKNIENQEFFLLNESIPDFVKARFGQRRCALIESQISRTNPTPVRYIVPVDFLEKNPSGEQRDLVGSYLIQPGSTWARLRRSKDDKKMQEGLELLIQAPSRGLEDWMWGFNDSVQYKINTAGRIPKKVTNIYLAGPKHKSERPLPVEIIY